MKHIAFLYIALAVAAAGYAAFWFYRADRVEDVIDTGTAALAAARKLSTISLRSRRAAASFSIAPGGRCAASSKFPA